MPDEPITKPSPSEPIAPSKPPPAIPSLDVRTQFSANDSKSAHADKVSDDDEAIYDDTSEVHRDDDEQIYDDTIGAVNSPAVQMRPKAGGYDSTAVCHSIEEDSTHDPLYPPLPPKQFIAGSELDYTCIYVAKWDNLNAKAPEMSYKRGELLQLVGKDYESHGWWTMTNGKSVGIVPCVHLTAAFELVQSWTVYCYRFHIP